MSTVKVNKIEKRSGSTLTLGGPGTAVTLACGATQTGFGRTGTVDWCTTAKTSPFTSVSGKGYFINTTGGAVTVTLPSSPSAGDIISIKDYANTFDTNNLTICRSGSNVSGVALNPIISTEGESMTLIYVDGTKGWLNIQTDDTVKGAPLFICATGGTITCSGDFRIHTFNADSTFTINSAPTPGNNNVSYMVVAGGGAGGPNVGPSGSSATGGGGGAGGFREGETPASPYTGSPLKNSSGLPVSVQSYPITVGGGGAISGPHPTEATGGSGGASTFSSITSAGGGGGGNDKNNGLTGGSGGGRGGESNPGPGAAGNTPPVSPPQGNDGGAGGYGGPAYGSGGGGGATAAGSGGSTGDSGDGGTGATSSISASPVGYSGGGGGGGYGPGQAFGTQGGGNGTRASGASCGAAVATAGTTNRGGGGGGGGANPATGGREGAAGGSGVVIIRYKFQ
jgi:hypothetical protein